MTTELWLALFGILATIVGAVSYIGKRQADANSAAADARAKAVEADAQTKIIQAKTEADKDAALIRVSERQQSLMESWDKRLELRDADILSRWGTVSAMFNDTKAVETNVYNALAGLNTAVSNLFTKSESDHAMTIAAIGALPGAIREITLETVRETATLIGAEIGAQIAKEFRIQTIERDVHPFPDAEDARWHMAFVKPLVADVTINKDVRLGDATRLTKPCAKIKADGEIVWLIDEPAISGFYVRKETEPCWGYLAKHMIQVAAEGVSAN